MELTNAVRTIAILAFTEEEYLRGTARIVVGRFIVSIQNSILTSGEWMELWSLEHDTKEWKVRIVTPRDSGTTYAPSVPHQRQTDTREHALLSLGDS